MQILREDLIVKIKECRDELEGYRINIKLLEEFTPKLKKSNTGWVYGFNLSNDKSWSYYICLVKNEVMKLEERLNKLISEL